MYNGQFTQCLEITIDCNSHKDCLYVSNTIRKQCDAWYFNVEYTEDKSARKGDVLQRTLMIYQTAYASDIVIFKEAIRRICEHFSLHNYEVKFRDRGSEPVNNLRQNVTTPS